MSVFGVFCADVHAAGVHGRDWRLKQAPATGLCVDMIVFMFFVWEKGFFD